MNLKILAAGAAALALAAAGSASAGLTSITTVIGDTGVLPLIDNFDSPIATGYTFTQDFGGAFIGNTAIPGVSAPPPGDSTNYETVVGGSQATLTAAHAYGLTHFSFYMGSPDAFNGVTFQFFDGSGNKVLAGQQIWGGTPPAQPGPGNQVFGYTVTYTFDTAVQKIVFKSSNNSFEFDNLRGAVPEPATWGMMILGFAGVGAALRNRRRVAAFA